MIQDAAVSGHERTDAAEQQTHGPFRPFASSRHQVTKGRYITSNDPRGYIPVYEYPLNNQWIMMDIDDGYVLWTGIWKALGNSKADIVKMVDSQPELARVIRRVRGGYLKIQGTWMPFEVALRLARRVAWNIREDLVPLFGPTFPGTCLSPDQPGYGQVVANSGIRRRQRKRDPAAAATGSPPAASNSSASGPGSLPAPGQISSITLSLPLPPHPQPNPNASYRAAPPSAWPGSSSSNWHQQRDRSVSHPPPSSPSPFFAPPLPQDGAQAAGFPRHHRYAPYPASPPPVPGPAARRRLSGSMSSSRSPPLELPTPRPRAASPPPPYSAGVGVGIPPLQIQRLPPPSAPKAAHPGYALPPISAMEDVRGADARAVLRRLRADDDQRSPSPSRSPERHTGTGIKRAYSVPQLQLPPIPGPGPGPVSPAHVHRRSLGQLPLPPHPAPAGLGLGLGLGYDHPHGRGLGRGFGSGRDGYPRRPSHAGISDASSASASASSRAPSPITPRSPTSTSTSTLSLVPLKELLGAQGQGQTPAPAHGSISIPRYKQNISDLLSDDAARDRDRVSSCRYDDAPRTARPW
ncbi:HTH APSES-type domain-containing protein [Mycena kentingensis (nom. inval.)]|nr:HTH APSES-type domain-containing protein [Mycena kentingensis (nom. inval.)]